ncbi:putative 2-haloacid dehalogenase protein (plasmid) [Rhizobium etli CIAT 652]|uniref:Putative 2-haloacid dehalogenase protein n=1 Tax=Rhizobium etli (strain CIAT 652) TaxID=491916 RepID=B3Q376_RHIE6|nr:putative 2-haloacid dehalogenase protein [Rhizobium etli CIAT 652]
MASFRRIRRGTGDKLKSRKGPDPGKGGPSIEERDNDPAGNRIFFFEKRAPIGAEHWGIRVSKSLPEFKYLTFDVVGTLIDFEGGLKTCLADIAVETGHEIDGEQALSLYRDARYCDDADLFPDDLVRVYLAIAPKLGLPADQKYGERLRDSAKSWKAFADSAAALARLAKNYRLVAMTNARRWAFAFFEKELGSPFHAAFTADDTGTEKPDPAFFETVFAYVASEGHSKDDILHVAQSQYHDIGISRKLGLTNCWIERRHAEKGYGGTIEPAEFTTPDYHFTSMAGLADAVAAARA